ncbi:Organic cation transporter protein [Cryptotermes secundus]|uniref:Organic cation transporter protein n=4 Tax=Cryptotermes secundus TaxID=105785 RepID=A0A2J7Q7G1_9NEOP|nr:organic cation transporter protein isoform X2 [Cryptotermes secundus]XP_023716547.1 organic cation transporter protein isoform X2 [Cryptotermes secundus]XP_023716548.1 organic cation transporter protein isoform X2 [Cryptotermes secundus]PNF24518.1 Organic cation transporter protein [Cryptotermes secundus]PNF24519.1 Organic cation transporter protein [Cryptotermes secundus]PNF24520.1 Organic cation transporter protein [Cryptotermes secundus]
MAYDDILPYLGEFGRYQKRIYLLLCLPAILCALHKLAGVFLQANIKHRCQLPYEYDNATYNLPEINMTIPWDSKANSWSSCTRLDANFTPEYFNSSITANKSVKCEKWIYDTSVYKSSAVTEFNLVCDDAHFRVMADSLFMVGALLGSIIFGDMSDRFGRRPIFFLSLVLQVVFGLLAAAATEYYTFMLCRLVIGSTTSGVFLVAYVIAMEMVGPTKRLYAGVVCQFFFTTGYILTAAFAYFIKDWRILQVALSAPGIVFLCYWWFVPESARWLITKGRGVEAKEILLKAAKENKVTIPEDILDNLLTKTGMANGDLPSEQGAREKKTRARKATLFHLFHYPNLRKRTLVILFSWFVNSGTYYGLSWNTSNLGGNDYINFLLAGAVEYPGYAFLLLTLNRWGRKAVLCGCMIVGGVALLLTSVVPSDMNWLIITLAMIGKMVITSSYGTVYVFSAEQFPTVVRNIGIGAASTSARIGGILAPYTLLLGDQWRPLPLLIYGALALCGGLLSLLLPETLNKKLPDTIEEGEMFGIKHKDDDALDGNMDDVFKN